jgi:hypothetical protein
MILPSEIHRRLSAQPLTRTRIAVALGVGVVADGLQMLLGPLGWWGADELIDLGAMGLTTLALGFHPLLLPTFIMEFIPLVDMLPTWTGCVVAVIALRKKAEHPGSANIPPVVDVPPANAPPAQIGDAAPPRPRPTVDTPRRDDSNSPTL